MSPIKQFRLRTFKAGHAWGTILYPISLAIVTYLGFGAPWLILGSFFPMVYGDGTAAIFGPKAVYGKFELWSGTKSLIGTFSMILFTWISIIPGAILMGYSPEFGIVLASVTSLLVAPVELLSPKGFDNLMIPLVIFPILIYLEPLITGLVPLISISLYGIALIIGLIFGVGGYYAGVLTGDGAIAGFLITTFMFGFGSYTIGVQLLIFFVLGSAATKIVQKIAGSTQDRFEKGGERRDSLQAIAKTGLPAIISMFFLFNGDFLYFYIVTGIMCASLTDTMSTEVGIAIGGTPRSVFTPWKEALVGDNGVITVEGTLGGILSGIVFSMLVLLTNTYDPNYIIEMNYGIFVLIITFSGFFGMIADSIIGATLQRRNQCQICHQYLETDWHHKQETVHEKGLSWFNNDLTNILGTAIGGMVAFILYLPFS